MIRENDDQLDKDVYPDFITHTISDAPLSGEAYKADRITVLILLFPSLPINPLVIGLKIH